MRKPQLSLLVASLCAGAIAVAPSAQSAPVKKMTDEEKNAEITAYQEAHPDDLAGLERLAEKHTGMKMEVLVEGVDEVLTGEQAQPYIDAEKAKQKEPKGDVGTAAIPTDAFNVGIYTTPLAGPPPTKRVTGRWNYRDNWAGQAAPHDFGSVGLRVPDCMQLSDYVVTTYTYNNTRTNLGYLKSSNLANDAPIWGVNDYTSGFVSQADNGYMNVTLKNYCGATKSLAAAFEYEANQGSSVTSVSAGWGFLSISYGGSNSHLQKGTAPLYFSN